MVPELPRELWREMLITHGPLAAGPWLRLCPRELGASRLQRAWRRVERPSWEHGQIVRVRVDGTWRLGHMFRMVRWTEDRWAVELILSRPGRPYRRKYLFYDGTAPCVRMRRLRARQPVGPWSSRFLLRSPSAAC